jgi:hypothetical protein
MHCPGFLPEPSRVKASLALLQGQMITFIEFNSRNVRANQQGDE